MRKRRKSELGDYDSLTDTVTNVVGVLVIVLAVTRVSLGNRVPSMLAAESGPIRTLGERERAERAKLGELQSEIEVERSRSAGESTWTVPFPDPARADGKELVAFYCQSSRIHPFRFEDLREILNERARGILGVQYLSELEKHERVARYCRENDVGDDHLRWSVVVAKPEDRKFRARAELARRRPETGESAKDVASNGSAYRRVLESMDPRKQWICFYVWDDSFDLYLAADRIAKEKGFATGWIPFAEGERYGVALTHSGESGSIEESERPFPQ